MSESVAPTSLPPGAAEPGPTPGTQALAAADVAPAPLLTETITETPAVVVEQVVVEPVVVETPAQAEADKPGSVISDAKGEVPAEETPAEPKAEEKPEEVKAEEPKVEEPVKVPEPLAPPVYDELVLPEGVTLDAEKVDTFNGLVGEFENRLITDPSQAHALFSEMRQKLAEFYVNEAKESAERSARFQRETWDRTIDDWQKSFRDDPEIGKNRQDTTIQRIGGLLNLYGQQTNSDQEKAVRDAFGLTGAGNHPEVIRFVNWMASRLTERPRVVTPMLPRAPVKGTQSRAERLYKTSTGAA